MSTNHTFTAVRTWNRPHTKATVTVTLDDGIVLTAGGARAARAEAVIVTKWPRNATPGIYGLRADAHAAQVEAARLGETRAVKSGRYGNYTTTPAAMAIAVLITEAVPA